MKNPRIWRAAAVALFCIGMAVVIGVAAYQAGVAQGLATTSHAMVEPPAAGPYPWNYGGHGFFFAPFFLLILVFLVARSLFWRRPWRGGCHHRHDGVPPAFEEWHRRLHEQQTPPRSAEK